MANFSNTNMHICTCISSNGPFHATEKKPHNGQNSTFAKRYGHKTDDPYLTKLSPVQRQRKFYNKKKTPYHHTISGLGGATTDGHGFIKGILENSVITFGPAAPTTHTNFLGYIKP